MQIVTRGNLGWLYWYQTKWIFCQNLLQGQTLYIEERVN